MRWGKDMEISLGERIRTFEKEYARMFLAPVSTRMRASLSSQGLLVQLIYDLIDDRGDLCFALTRALMGKTGKVR